MSLIAAVNRSQLYNDWDRLLLPAWLAKNGMRDAFEEYVNGYFAYLATVHSDAAITELPMTAYRGYFDALRNTFGFPASV